METQARRIPEIAYCSEKRRLMLAFVEAVQELGALHKQQGDALIEGDPDFARFDVLLHMANQKEDAAKYELMEHLENHRCEDVSNVTESRGTRAAER